MTHPIFMLLKWSRTTTTLLRFRLNTSDLPLSDYLTRCSTVPQLFGHSHELSLPLIQSHFRRTMASAIKQPPWESPPPAGPNAELPPLRVWNSLTKSKTPFVPIDWQNKKVSWYACGPTVYDDAHLGHARNYVSTDIIRRIMRDFFKFKVKFVMNITDVDDKVCG